MIKIKLYQIHKKDKSVTTYAGKINGKGFTIQMNNDMPCDKATIKNFAKSWVFDNIEIVLK